MQSQVLRSDLMLSPELDILIPYSRAHLYRLEEQGDFPRRRRIGANRIAWVRSEIEQWLSQKMEILS